jgi:D-3-phosphoglycerate dehydrogenase
VIPADSPTQIGDSPQLARLREAADVRLYQERPVSTAELLRRAREADVMINSRGHVKWPGELLELLPRLRMISTCSIGTDSIDLEAASRLGIVVSNIPGRTAAVVAEHALALLLAASRRTSFQTAELKAGRWTRMDTVFLGGKTLGVVGVGSIGAAMAKLGQAIGMHVVAWTFSPSPERQRELGVTFVELEELLKCSDAISLHVKLTPQSRGMIGRRELQWMKPGSLLVNTARGDLVDTAALVEALQSGHLAGAALDVFDEEPLPADHPILACEQIVLTPHAADQTPEGVEILNGGAVDNVLAFLRGEPQHVVTRP